MSLRSDPCFLRPAHLRSPEDHAAALHAGGRGHVTIARKHGGAWHESAIPVPELPYAVRQLRGVEDIYITQNRFFGPRRLVAHLAALNALFIDLDYYRTPHADAHPQHVLALALEALERAEQPSPSFALDTGRGLALVWLHTPLPRAALPRWRACQKELYTTLKQLGADPLATDAARVLRLTGTRNSRVDRLVEALTPVGQLWNFDLLADEILPLTRSEIISLRLERAAHRPHDRLRPRPACCFEAAGLWEGRLAELQLLLKHRWFDSLPTGERDAWLVLGGTAMGYLVPGRMVRREIHALAHEVTGGHWSTRETDSRMSSVIRRAEYAALGRKIEYGGRLVDPRYRFCTETIVEMLGITENEMRSCGFRHLVTLDIRREHDRQRQAKTRRAHGAVPRAEYEAQALNRIKPWEAEGISRATWYRRRETGPSRCMVGESLSPQERATP
ncbi:hypothetical protein [Geminicoccus flavidas]|uniref:hypothetical protein n=1 Tax=Geminicoccus flavidas TaxID=2506407 RepID=UPI0013568740|nr:hypothetical protein [Geminicoccus flavidas]